MVGYGVFYDFALALVAGIHLGFDQSFGRLIYFFIVDLGCASRLFGEFQYVYT